VRSVTTLSPTDGTAALHGHPTRTDVWPMQPQEASCDGENQLLRVDRCLWQPELPEIERQRNCFASNALQTDRAKKASRLSSSEGAHDALFELSAARGCLALTGVLPKNSSPGSQPFTSASSPRKPHLAARET